MQYNQFFGFGFRYIQIINNRLRSLNDFFAYEIGHHENGTSFHRIRQRIPKAHEGELDKYQCLIEEPIKFIKKTWYEIEIKMNHDGFYFNKILGRVVVRVKHTLLET